jgi:uncharacterized protein YjcR
MPRPFDPSIRARANELFDAGWRNIEIAAYLKVSPKIVGKWKRRRKGMWKPSNEADSIIFAAWDEKTKRLMKENEKLRLMVAHRRETLSWRAIPDESLL